MSSELLREAASKMRIDHGPEHVRHVMWSAMADWLDLAAEHQDIHEQIRAERPDDPNVPEKVRLIEGGLAVARAYLEVAS